MPETVSNEVMIFYGAVILLFLLISAFFSASETALTAVSRARIYQLVKEGNRRAQTVSRLRKEKESLIGALLIGNNLVNTASSTVATAFFLQLFGDNEHGLVIVTLVMATLIILISEIFPKTYAIQNAERTALMLAPTISPIVKLLSPVTWFIHALMKFFMRLCGIDAERSNTLISATDVIRGTVELHHREGKLVKQDRDMLGSILDLNDLSVRDIMVHRTNLDMLDADLPPDELAARAFSMMHSRIPLWKDNPDNIVGVLHMKDLVRRLHNKEDISGEALALAHPAWFIPETTSLRDQLIAFRARRQHFAVVVDEYGALLGVVTLEDIIEEIVGKIDDEHDEHITGDVQRAGNGAFYVAGSVTIRDLNRELDWDLPDEHASTVGGLVMHESRAIPPKGQSFEWHGYRFTVVDRTRTQVRRLKIERLGGDVGEDEV